MHRSEPPISVAQHARTGTPSGCPLTNQRGMALVVALGMLAIMTVLGMMAMSISDTELSISGNFRALQESFFAADRAVSYAQTNPDIFLAAAGTPIDLYADATHRGNIEVGRSGLEPTATNEASPLGLGPVPVAAVSDATMFEARYLMINVTGVYPTGIPNPARTEVETQVARIVPKN